MTLTSDNAIHNSAVNLHVSKHSSTHPEISLSRNSTWNRLPRLNRGIFHICIFHFATPGTSAGVLDRDSGTAQFVCVIYYSVNKRRTSCFSCIVTSDATLNSARPRGRIAVNWLSSSKHIQCVKREKKKGIHTHPPEMILCKVEKHREALLIGMPIQKRRQSLLPLLCKSLPTVYASMNIDGASLMNFSLPVLSWSPSSIKRGPLDAPKQSTPYWSKKPLSSTSSPTFKLATCPPRTFPWFAHDWSATNEITARPPPRESSLDLLERVDVLHLFVNVFVGVVAPKSRGDLPVRAVEGAEEAPKRDERVTREEIWKHHEKRRTAASCRSDAHHVYERDFPGDRVRDVRKFRLHISLFSELARARVWSSPCRGLFGISHRAGVVVHSLESPLRKEEEEVSSGYLHAWRIPPRSRSCRSRFGPGCVAPVRPRCPWHTRRRLMWTSPFCMFIQRQWIESPLHLPGEGESYE